MVGPGTAREGKKKGEVEGEEETGDYEKLLACLERFLEEGVRGRRGEGKEDIAPSVCRGRSPDCRFLVCIGYCMGQDSKYVLYRPFQSM